MSDDPILLRALALAAEFHGQLFDRRGLPVLAHVLRVVAGSPPGKARVVAALHDYLEDGGSTALAREAIGGDEEIYAAIEVLTRRPDEMYHLHVHRVAQNALARSVKLADLADNIARNEADPPSARRDSLLRRYLAAQIYLRNGNTLAPAPVVDSEGRQE